MSSESSKQIIYFLLANYINKKEIGSYLDSSDSGNSINNLNKIISTSKEILKSATDDIKGKKNKVLLDDYVIYYILTTTNTFYLAVVKKFCKYTQHEGFIFELFENIEHQGIKKLVDSNGELKMVGKQNLKFCIEQDQENKSNLNNENDTTGLFKNNQNLSTNIDYNNPNKDEEENINEQPSKITLLNNTIIDIRNDMKQSVQNLITNVSDMQDLDNKSAQIKDASYKFQQDAAALERKMRCRKLFMKGVIIGVLSLIFIIILYCIFK